MKAILDTHFFLWWIAGSPQVSPKAHETIADGSNTLYLSAASGWEIAIKAKLGKLTMPEDIKVFLMEQLSLNSIHPLAVQLNHTLQVYSLPFLHRDPFDRLLIAQSQLENYPIITADEQISKYPVEIIW